MGRSDLEVDASNACIPIDYNLHSLTPPLPSTVRGEPCVFDGKCGRINQDKALLLYSNGRLVIIRDLGCDDNDNIDFGTEKKKTTTISQEKNVKAFVYRGHTAQVTAAKFSPSGCYVASADIRGRLRVWSYDNEEHLCKLELPTALAGPIRDISWDFESKRLCLVGEGSKTDSSSDCARVIQWDTGVTCGELGQHTRNRATSCSFKPNRPMRIVTGGGDDSRCFFNKGPPFVRVADMTVSEQCHTRGAVNCVRFSPDGTKIASVGTDKSLCIYQGKSMELIYRLEGLHDASIYTCDWNSTSDFVITTAADGKVKLVHVAADTATIVHTWDVATEQVTQMGLTISQEEGAVAKVPLGGMQMGCAFVSGDIPVSVSLNGQIAILPLPPDIMPSAGDSRTTATKFLTGHQSVISAMTINHGNGTMYTADTDGLICTWDLDSANATGRINRELDGSLDQTLMHKVHTGAITSMVQMGGFLYSAGWDDTIRITPIEQLQTEVIESDLKIDAQPNAMAKGTNLIAVMTVGGLLIMKDRRFVSQLIEFPFAATSVCVSKDDAMVYVGGDDFIIHVYQVSTAEDSSCSLVEIGKLGGQHQKAIHAVSLSNDGTKLASADARDVCVWSVPASIDDDDADWSKPPIVGRSRWCFHTQRINTLAWFHDDSILASGGNDDSIYLWSLAKKMKRVHYSFAHRGGVTGLEFLPNQPDILVSVGSDGCAVQWDVAKDVKEKFG